MYQVPPSSCPSNFKSPCNLPNQPWDRRRFKTQTPCLQNKLTHSEPPSSRLPLRQRDRTTAHETDTLNGQVTQNRQHSTTDNNTRERYTERTGNTGVTQNTKRTITLTIIYAAESQVIPSGSATDDCQFNATKGSRFSSH
ncbi:hypothetical protein Pcinc_028624 [Petrolisthes cinctipes]|uniref:Uncharacterized protein n=1 Tax=Petrolisthes cinctipes TaxID=88211 RepID=A0AAE1F2P5_PETCI|nr:hypothetical protein Pcinc_028624 [Petrolisthes cinctipes]